MTTAFSADPAARAGAILDIDLGAIVANWRQLATMTAPAECAAVVKADGYGLGAVAVGRALTIAGCRRFFVATLDEGVALRQALGDGPEIAVLNGPLPRTVADFIAFGLTPVLNDPGQIEEWAGTTAVTRSAAILPAFSGGAARQDAGGPNSAPAILQLDTGMSRLGLTAREFAALLETPPQVAWRAVMSHLACAGEPDHALNETQRARFAAAVARLPKVQASLAASSGVFLGPPYHFDLVRPGAALFGVNPFPGRPNPLRPVVRLRAKILQIRQIDRGESVGYGATHQMQGPGRIATAAVGYADGWRWSFSGRGCGFIGATRVPLVGRVSMDLATFDVSAVPEHGARPGMLIELLGPHYGVDDAAADAGTIGYEILTSLGRRYHRVYHGGGEGFAA